MLDNSFELRGEQETQGRVSSSCAHCVSIYTKGTFSWNRHQQPGASSWRAVYRKHSEHRCDSFFDTEQAEMTPFRNFPACRLESAAIIPDVQLHLFGGEIEDRLDSRLIRMVYSMGRGFFPDAQ